MSFILTPGFIRWDGLKFVLDPGPGTLTVTPIKISSYTANIGDLVRCDPTAGGFTITLPSALNNVDKTIIVKNVTSSTNSVTINTTFGQLIDGSLTQIINIAEQSLTFVSDGNNWIIV